MFELFITGFRIQFPEIPPRIRSAVANLAFSFVRADKSSTDPLKTVKWRVETDDPARFAHSLPLRLPGRIEPLANGYRLLTADNIRSDVLENGTEVRQIVPRPEPATPDRFLWSPISSHLRMFMATEFPAFGGLLVHGSSLADGGVGRLFIGPSGAGKSTVCDLGDGRRVFCDEISILSRRNGVWMVHPSPFFSDKSRADRQGEALPLGSIQVLEKSKEIRLEPLSFAEAAEAFLACVMHFREEPVHAARLLDLFADLYAEIPLFRMHFRKDPDFWRLFEDPPAASRP